MRRSEQNGERSARGQVCADPGRTRQRHLQGSAVCCLVLVGSAAVSSASEQTAAGCLAEKCHRCQLLQTGTGAPPGTSAVPLQLSRRMPRLTEPAQLEDAAVNGTRSCKLHPAQGNTQLASNPDHRSACCCSSTSGTWCSPSAGPRGVPVHLMPSQHVSEKLLRC